MLKLYKKDENGAVVEYHEAWFAGDHVVEHWGPLGQQGESEQRPIDASLDQDANVEKALEGARKEGFAEIPDEDHAALFIEYPIEGLGHPEDVRLRHALEDRMNETLGWTGLGHCDGGSIGSGSMEVCCFVVDFERARSIIADDLEGSEFAKFSRIYDEDEV